MNKLFATQLTEVFTTLASARGDNPGDIRYDSGKFYKFVNLKNTTATVVAAAGSLVAYFAATGYANSRVVVDLSDADAIVACAGATLAAVPGVLTVDYWCWIQLTGNIVLDTAVTNAAAGKSFFLSTTDKTGTVGANAYDQKAGISTNTTTGAILTCMF